MWVLLVLMVCSAFQLHAQINSGLTGSVSDPSGAATPGAHLTFRNVATGILTQAVSSSEGLYAVNLVPGSYDVTAELSGFKRFLQSDVLVEVGATATLNIKLSVGSTSETVHVQTSNAIQINTTQPQLDTMLPPAEITNLPLEINGNMRQINSFATLAPGVRTGQYGSITVEGGDPYQINSAGAYYNGLQLDTASAINSNPPYEMVDEFRVLRSTFSARYGLVQGAISYNMRSGTNRLHGDAFMIDRNSVFDSAGFFPSNFNSGGAPIAPVDQETDWGGTIGGPVVLPKIYNGHDKTFFLGSLDIFNKNQGVTTVGSVPTPAMKNGDFSQFVDATGKLIPIYDPQTGQQFMGCNGTQPNVICPTRFDPLSKSLLQYIPDPNTTGTNYGLQDNMNPVITSVPYKTQAWGLTLTHQLTPTQSLAFTWWRNHYTVVQEEDAPIVPVSNPLTGEQSGVDNANIWLANYAKTFSPNMVMTAGFAGQLKMQNYVNDNNSANFAGVTGGGTMPYISFNGQNAITPFGNSNSEHVQNYVNNIGWNVFDNLLWTKGRHTLNIGGEYHHYYQYTLSNYSAGHFSFSQAETSVPNTSDPNFAKYGSSFASFLLGEVDSASRSSVATVSYHTQDISAYIQDDIKLTKKLTVSPGVRWDIMVPYMLSQNNDVFLNPTAPNPAAGNLAGAATEFGNCAACAGYNRAAINWKDFGPHLGIAYSFTPKTVLQLGYYINYLGFDSAFGQGEGLGAPVSMAGLLGGSFTANGTGSNIPGYGEWSNAQGQPVPLPNVSPTPFSQGLGVAQTMYYLDPTRNGRAPMYQAWNASVQRQLGWNTLITLAYSGNRATHLADSRYNINPISQPNASVLQYGSVLTSNINSAAAKAAGFQAPYAAFATQFGGGATVYQSLKNFPQYSGVTRAFDQGGTTFYNAFQIEADKHVGNGLTFMADVTLPSQFDNLATPEDKNNPSPEYVETSDSWETRIATTYLLPIGMGQRWLNNGHLGRWLGGWGVAGIVTYNNAGPLQVTQSGEGLMNGVNRPNIAPGVKMWSGNWGSVKPYFEGKGPIETQFSTNAFANTGNEFNLGNAKRDYAALRGPLYPVENLSAQKRFRITEGSWFAVRMDYFNAFNRTQLPYPSTNINASNFGEITSKFAGGNRQGQIEGTFTF
ncbi:MAG TPA: carboxypeptidase regulatory-like domain-containing protein [Acidobacteriaceae bacterium]|nr:carboxypeptidase regulatory-like domain-containing protein [Acidobacteriaceae bacterium]